MRHLLTVIALLLSGTACAQTSTDYGILIISRERLELATPCDVGVYLQDQLATRLMPGQTQSFNLPPGTQQVGLGLVGSGVCNPGIARTVRIAIDLAPGQIRRFLLTQEPGGLALVPADPL